MADRTTKTTPQPCLTLTPQRHPSPSAADESTSITGDTIAPVLEAQEQDRVLRWMRKPTTPTHRPALNQPAAPGASPIRG